jgi:pyruvate/2-oxoglutarate/acetoin dehydrogenase E1 component
MIEDVPDEQFDETPLDKAAIRSEGNDITIVGSGGGMPEVLKATENCRRRA